MGVLKSKTKKTQDEESAKQPDPGPAPAAQAPAPKTPAWGSRGKKAQQTFQKEQATREARQAQNRAPMDFYLKAGEVGQITFVDGALDSDGMLDMFAFYQHEVRVGPKKWDRFVCTQEVEPCPLCDSGLRPSYVAAFTVIDHRVIKSTKTPGKVYKDQPKILLAKQQSLNQLQARAKKHGGLVGTRWEVTRTPGEKIPKIGDVWEFEAKIDVKTLADEKGVIPVFDYGKAIPYLNAAELRALGYTGAASIGDQSSSDGADVPEDSM